MTLVMPSSAKRVLIIDDEPYVLEVLGAYFRLKGGYAVVTASTAEEGLAEAARARPDLILLDIRLPKMSGIEGLKELRNTVGRIPVIMISGTTDSMAPSTALAYGALAYLTKPFNFEHLDHAVALALGQTPETPR